MRVIHLAHVENSNHTISILNFNARIKRKSKSRETKFHGLNRSGILNKISKK